jgi:hypothetical protein
LLPNSTGTTHTQNNPSFQLPHTFSHQRGETPTKMHGGVYFPIPAKQRMTIFVYRVILSKKIWHA